MKTLAMMSLLLCGAVASAEIPSDVDWKNIKNDTRFVKLMSNEQTADYNSKTWSKRWDGAQPPEKGKWYYSNGMRLFVPSTMQDPFPGDLLVLDSQFRNPGSVTWKVNDFVALPGGFIGIRRTENGGLFVDGDMLVTTPDGSFQIVADNSSRKTDKAQTIELNVTGALTGDETAEIHFGSSEGVYNDATPTSNQFLSVYTLKVTAGDASEYKGRLTLDDASLELCSDFGGTVELKNVRIGTDLDVEPYPSLQFSGCGKVGGIVVNPCVAIKNPGSVTVDELALAPGSAFNLDAAGTWKVGKIVGEGGRLVFSRSQTGLGNPLAGLLEITEGFDDATRIEIENTASAWTDATPAETKRIAILRIAASVDPTSVSLDRFSFHCAERTNKLAENGTFPIQQLELERNQDGSHTLYLVSRGVISLVTGAGTFAYAESAAKWSDGLLPHGDKDYFVAYTDSPTTMEFTEDVTFPAANLLVRNAIVKIHADVTVTNLVLARTAQLSVSSKTDRLNRISGRIGIFGEVTEQSPYSHTTVFTASETSKKDPYVLNVASDLYGPGVLQVRNNGIIRLSGDNSEFCGRIIWYLDETKSESNQTILEIDNATALGGELDAPCPDAVVLANNGLLRARESVALTSLTRGLKIAGPAGFDAPDGVTFSIANPLDYEATLTKTGAGILALGGTPTVGTAGRLVVGEGTLKPISGTALKGLPVEFANGAELLIDPAQISEGVEIGDLTVAPGTKLTVRILGQDDGLRHHETVPLLVFPTVAQAEAACAVLKVKSPYAQHSARLSVVETASGRAQVQAEILVSGFVLMIR